MSEFVKITASQAVKSPHVVVTITCRLINDDNEMTPITLCMGAIVHEKDSSARNVCEIEEKEDELVAFRIVSKPFDSESS